MSEYVCEKCGHHSCPCHPPLVAENQQANGPGTPAGRMQAVWDWLHEEGAGREQVLERLCPGWSIVSSRIASEEALMVAFDAMRAESQQLRDALYFGIETCNRPDSLPTMRQCGEFVIAARAALAGTPSEDTE